MTKQNSTRLALIIGNKDYKTSPLANPVNDANDMAEILRQLGFKVIKKLNMGQREMVDTISDFGKELHNFDIGLFYFSGHGLQYNGDNYLLPIEGIRTYSDITYDGVNVGRIVDKMKDARNPLNIIILDACRSAPPIVTTERSLPKGLVTMNAPKGTLIAYATGPGMITQDGPGRSSPYTKSILNHISKDCFAVEKLFIQIIQDVIEQTSNNQIPWESSSLVGGDFYFAEC